MDKITLEHGYVLFFNINNVPDKIIDIIKTDNETCIKNSDFDRHDIYYEQLITINGNYDNAYFVSAYNFEDIYIGGVILYLKDKPDYVNPDVPAFQGIAKSMHKTDIKLNSLLIPAMISFVKTKGFNQLNVEPLDRQKKILLDYYNFIEKHFGELSYKII